MPSAEKLIEMGFLHSAVVCPELRVADVDFNTTVLLGIIERASAEGIHLVVTPELGITGYSCADLFYQHNLLRRALEALVKIATATAETGVTILVGLPLESHGRLYNCAALCGEGRILGLIPKTYLPTYGEFYEERWFTGSNNLPGDTFWLGKEQTSGLLSNNAAVPFGADLLFEASDLANCVIGVEICEDLWLSFHPAARPPWPEPPCC
jgi:NAD+ synthase (glutamine-hydrolysing)